MYDCMLDLEMGTLAGWQTGGRLATDKKCPSLKPNGDASFYLMVGKFPILYISLFLGALFPCVPLLPALVVYKDK